MNFCVHLYSAARNKLNRQRARTSNFECFYVNQSELSALNLRATVSSKCVSRMLRGFANVFEKFLKSLQNFCQSSKKEIQVKNVKNFSAEKRSLQIEDQVLEIIRECASVSKVFESF